MSNINHTIEKIASFIPNGTTKETGDAQIDPAIASLIIRALKAVYLFQTTKDKSGYDFTDEEYEILEEYNGPLDAQLNGESVLSALAHLVGSDPEAVAQFLELEITTQN